MKIFLLLFFISFCTLTNAKTIHLTYQPKGFIVCFNLDSLKVFSDTSEVLNSIDHFKDNFFKTRARNFILKSIKQCNGDTLNFNDFIEFNDGEKNHNPGWYISSLAMQLTQYNKAKIIEKSGRQIKSVIIKKVGTKKKGLVKRSFYDAETKKELFYQRIFIRISE